MRYKLYTPFNHEKKELSAYWEAWRTLPFPQDMFEEVQTAAGDIGLRYNKAGHYVWISPETKRNMSSREFSPLLVMIEQKKVKDGEEYKDSGKVNATYVMVSDSLRPVRQARNLNNDLLSKVNKR